MLKYRQKNREKMREYDRKRYKEKNRNEFRRRKVFAGKFCKICEIRLDGNYGARGTRVYCKSCSDNRKLVHKLYMRKYRELKFPKPKPLTWLEQHELRMLKLKNKRQNGKRN